MTNSLTQLVKLSLVLVALLSFAACGQKGPLEVEQPPAQTQTEEIQETK